jgi:hypothetical protein
MTPVDLHILAKPDTATWARSFLLPTMQQIYD